MPRSVPVVVLRGPDVLASLSDTLAQVLAGGSTDDARGAGTTAVLVDCSPVAPAGPDLVAGVLDAIRAQSPETEGITVLAGIPRRDRDLGWTTSDLASRLGYDDLIDPHIDATDAELPEASVHRGRPLSEAWTSATRRVLIGSCSTDARLGCSLTLETLGSLAPPIPGADPAECVADLLRHAAPDLCILDARLTSHGPAGASIARPVPTQVLVVSPDALLVDVVGAGLLGLDPKVSATLAACLKDPGLPETYAVTGDLTPLEGVRPPASALREAASTLAAEAPLLGRLADALLTPSQDPSGHLEGDPVLRVLRDAAAPWLRAADDLPGAELPVTVALSAATVVAQGVKAWRTMYAKDSLHRVDTPLGMNLGDWTAADYDAVEEFLRPTETMIEALPAGKDGLRWRHVDGAVLFEACRVAQAPYDSWVERVEVAESIQLMADYIGGRCVVVARDGEGRPIRQAERNLYLPQPNYLALSGGQVIDVCKLEVIRYEKDRRTIWWRTVRSPNGSADYDDGSVEFRDLGDGRTRVTVRGRQRFVLPLFWQAFDLDRVPELRDALTEDAYQRFFTTTLDNFEARYEGRSFAVGHAAEEGELPSLTLSRLLATADSAVRGWLETSTVDGVADRARPAPEVDADGFRHVRGSRH